MATPTYTKGQVHATVSIEVFDDGRYKGRVAIQRDDEPGKTHMHHVVAFSTSESEAFEEAHALAHRLLADQENQ